MEVGPASLFLLKEGLGHLGGGVIDGPDQAPIGPSYPQPVMGEPSTCNIIPSASLLSLRARCLGGRLLQGDAIPPERRIWRTFSRDSLIPSSLSFSVNCAALKPQAPMPPLPPSALS